MLVDLYWAGVHAAAPGPALAGVLAGKPAPGARLWIVALGKAARPMAEAAVAHLADAGLRPAGGLVIAPEVSGPVAGLPAVAGDHPFPGALSLKAAKALGDLAGRTDEGDEVWVLLSGGATSLAAAPVPGVSPEDLQALYRGLLSSGLDIKAMNTVRKRFSRWGAGRLAVALAPAKVRTYIVSDVIGDDVAAIGSGPCVADESRASDVRHLLAGLGRTVPGSVETYLGGVEQDPSLETPKAADPAFQNADWRIVASNRLTLDAVADRARELGLEPKILPEPLSGEAAGCGKALALALMAEYPATCLIAGGETVVKIDPAGDGRGGRSQELALAAARALSGYPGATLLAAGTDGRDGPTDAAGAVVDGATWGEMAKQRHPQRDLDNHDSNLALGSVGALLVTGLTGTNVMDVVIGVVPAG